MKKVHFEKTIDAPAAKVWDMMLDKAAWQAWTSPFMEGSTFEGNWAEGSQMQFLDPEGNGMVSEIAANRPPEFLSIKHVGVINKGIEDFDSEEAKKWTPAFENYALAEENGITTVAIDMDVADEYADMMSEAWPQALSKLKQMAEQ